MRVQGANTATASFPPMQAGSRSFLSFLSGLGARRMGFERGKGLGQYRSTSSAQRPGSTPGGREAGSRMLSNTLFMFSVILSR
jgi:hypothetical protein